MSRLLWKELRETGPLWIAAFYGQLLLMVVLGDRSGFTGDLHHDPWALSGSYFWQPAWVAEIVAAVWGATAAFEGLDRMRVSCFWFPIPRWKSFMVKFLPGVIGLALVAALLASSFVLVARFRLHDLVNHVDTFIAGGLKCCGRLLIAYCLSFSISRLTNITTGALLGFIGALLLNHALSTQVLGSMDAEGIWTLNRLYVLGEHYPGRHSATAGGIYLSYVLPLFAAQLFFAAMLATGAFLSWTRATAVSNRQAAWVAPPAALALLLVGVLVLSGRTSEGRVWPALDTLPSPDGQSLAFIPNHPMTSSEPLSLRLIDAKTGTQREALSGAYLNILAWSPDAKSVFVETAARKRDQTQIVKVTVDGRTALITVLPPVRSLRSTAGHVTPDGRFLVLSRLGVGSPSIDLWAIDLRNNHARVIAPNLDASHSKPLWNRLTDDRVPVQHEDGSLKSIRIADHRNRQERSP